MNTVKQITVARSREALLFLIPQAARNLQEVLRCATSSVPDADDYPEARNIFDEQEELLGQLYKAVEAMSTDNWCLAEVRLGAIITHCEERRAVLDREYHERRSGDLRRSLDEVFLKLTGRK
jgi:hypothetical protein